MDAVVIAGGVPEPDDPLYSYTQGMPKALLDICGKPMIQWVLDALCQAQTIEHVVIIGLPADSGVTCDKLAAFIPSQGSMLANIRAGALKVLEFNPNAGHILLASSDVPAITAESIDWVVHTTMQTDEDAYYNVITREVMEARYPASKRSYVRMRDAQVCGGDVNVVRTKTVTENHDLWERIVESRKNALKQAALLGYDTLILLLLRMITLEGAVKKVTRRLHLSGRAVVCPYAEIGMDVDKPHQLEMMRADLERRAST